MTGIATLGLNQDEAAELVLALQQRERCLAIAELCDDGPTFRDTRHHRLIVQSLLELVAEIEERWNECAWCGTRTESRLCKTCRSDEYQTVLRTEPLLRTIRRG